jgi:hypothetical protein
LQRVSTSTGVLEFAAAKYKYRDASGGEAEWQLALKVGKWQWSHGSVYGYCVGILAVSMDIVWEPCSVYVGNLGT